MTFNGNFCVSIVNANSHGEHGFVLMEAGVVLGVAFPGEAGLVVMFLKIKWVLFSKTKSTSLLCVGNRNVISGLGVPVVSKVTGLEVTRSLLPRTFGDAALTVVSGEDMEAFCGIVVKRLLALVGCAGGRPFGTHLKVAGLTNPMPRLNKTQHKSENRRTILPFLKRSATTPQKGALQNSIKYLIPTRSPL